MNDEEMKQRYDSRFQVPETKIDTAKDLIDFLRLTNPVWKTPSSEDEYSRYSPRRDNEWVRGWYFRGQGKDVSYKDQKIEWGLIPSAWREDSLLKLAVKNQGNINHIKNVSQNIKARLQLENQNVDHLNWDRIESACLQIRFEIDIVRHFLVEADKVGISIPNPVHEINLETIIDALARGKKDFFISLWNNPTFALAQHHGVPTRLLDWTTNPLVAAYFAASSSLIEREKSLIPTPTPNNFVIYAIHKAWLNMIYHDHNPWIFEVKIKKADNLFARLQQAITLVDPQGDLIYTQEGKYPDFVESLIGFDSLLNKEFAPLKITLPYNQADDLIRLLYLEGITKAQLMPSLNSVADVTKMRWRNS